MKKDINESQRNDKNNTQTYLVSARQATAGNTSVFEVFSLVQSSFSLALIRAEVLQSLLHSQRLVHTVFSLEKYRFRCISPSVHMRQNDRKRSSLPAETLSRVEKFENGTLSITMDSGNRAFEKNNAIHIICACANDGCGISLCGYMFLGVLVRKEKMLPKRLKKQY